METLFFSVRLLVGLCLSGIYIATSLAFPPNYDAEPALFEGPQITESQDFKHTLYEQQSAEENRGGVNTVTVTCYPDSMEIVVKADLFEVGTHIDGNELHLGVENVEFCRAVASSDDEYTISVGLSDCGTKHWITEDSLIYTNLLIYSPMTSPDGVIRMDEAVIPIECHYGRRYSLSSSSLSPTWIPFTSTQAAVELLAFDLRIMTSDGLYKRGSNVFYLGEPIHMEASVRVGHHMGLKVFMSSCVATLDPDRDSVPRYVFLANDGCLVDSQLQGSKSHFLPRTQADKLNLVIDAFRFHKETKGELYITCHLNAVPINDAEPQNKACTFINGRWRSADGNDYLCGYCQSQKEVGQTHSMSSGSGTFGPRSHDKPEAFWRSGMTNKGWEQEASVGLVVLPMMKSGPIPEDELPPILSKIGGPATHGSQWRTGINFKTGPLDSVERGDGDLEQMVLAAEKDLEKGLLPGPLLLPTPEPRDLGVLTSSSEQKREPSHVILSGDTVNQDAIPPIPAPATPDMLPPNVDHPSDVDATTLVHVDMSALNATTTDSDLSNKEGPK